MKQKSLLALITIPILFLFVFLGYECDYANSFKESYKIFALPLPDTVEFAGEPVDLTRPDIRESLDKELLINTYWQSQTLLFIKRANKYFPTIEPILKEYDIPDDFKYLTLVESGLTNAISPAGATGYWQILEGTGKEYGLEINNYVDERYHLSKSTVAACKYFLKAYQKFGNWTLVAASYNAGMRGIERQIEKQKEYNYYNLELSDETLRYVYRMLAIKEILAKPEEYGFNFRQQDLYKPDIVTYVQVDTSIYELADFAHNFDISYRELKYYNPWLITYELVNSKNKKYQIAIPLQNKQK